VSDRTVCYLASGKPAVVQYTGPSSFLPDTGGFFRFRDLAEAVDHLDAAVANYEENSRLARALAEEQFDARKVVSRVLELTL
jgi:glycosyltransferase involved in cell wall biosynthesis